MFLFIRIRFSYWLLQNPSYVGNILFGSLARCTMLQYILWYYKLPRLYQAQNWIAVRQGTHAQQCLSIVVVCVYSTSGRRGWLQEDYQRSLSAFVTADFSKVLRPLSFQKRTFSISNKLDLLCLVDQDFSTLFYEHYSLKSQYISNNSFELSLGYVLVVKVN